MIEFYSEKPRNFVINTEVSTVFMEWKKKILLLQYCGNKNVGEKWAIPGGKLERNETPLSGLLREIEEELCLNPSPTDLFYIRDFYIRHPMMHYHLHAFRWHLTKKPVIKINPNEHQNFCWQTINEFANLPLLDCQLEIFQSIYQKK